MPSVQKALCKAFLQDPILPEGNYEGLLEGILKSLLKGFPKAFEKAF